MTGPAILVHALLAGVFALFIFYALLGLAAAYFDGISTTFDLVELVKGLAQTAVCCGGAWGVWVFAQGLLANG